MGRVDRGASGRGRQCQQRQLAARARSRHVLRRAFGRRLRSLPPLRRRHRAAGGARARCLPLLARVVAHRARGGRVLARRARSLPADARRLPRARPDADADVPPLHVAALDRRGGRLGGAAHRRAVRALLRARDAHLGDLVPYACTLNEPNLGALLHTVIGIPTRTAPGLGSRGRRGGDDARSPLGVPARLGPARDRGLPHARTGSRSTRSRACAPRRRWG